MNGQAQREIIIKHLRLRKTASIVELRNAYAIASPSSRVSELINEGYNILKSWREVTRNGWQTEEIVYSLGSPLMVER